MNDWRILTFIAVWALIWSLIATVIAARFNRWVPDWRVGCSAGLVFAAAIVAISILGAEIARHFWPDA